jgi:hypothetical protein
MQVQISLEDESLPKKARGELRAKEAELLEAHEEEWLGELAPYVLDDALYDDYAPHGPECRWRYGFVSALRLPCLTVGSAQHLATARATQFLRELRISDTGASSGVGDDHSPRVPTPPGVREHSELFELIGSPCLENLRIFQMGRAVEDEFGVEYWPYHRGYTCYTYVPGLEHVIASMPRVEELHLYCKSYNPQRLFALPNLTELRVLRVYHLGWRGREQDGRYEYPLDVLAQNYALGSLTHLLFHPHHEETPYNYDRAGRGGMPSFLPLEQVRAVLDADNMPRLTHLQLRLSNMGDEGVREIIASGILKRRPRLEWLDLRHGCITNEGAELLASYAHTRSLDHLDLSRNAVTDFGVNTLRQAGVIVRADRPLTAEELAEEQYLYEGDSE